MTSMPSTLSSVPRKDAASGDISLLEYLDLSQLNCLNESQNHTFKSIVSNKTKNTAQSKYLLSDADEQLLLNVTFNQAVRVRSIILQCNDDDRAPKVIKLFTNKPSLGFEDAEDAEEPEAAQVVELSSEVIKAGKPVPLRFVRFQTVNSLHIFVKSNHGGEDESRIDVFDVLGVPVEATKDLSGLQNQEE